MNYVVCIKQGSKYDSRYVNILYNMVTRNLRLDHEFICFTDDTHDLESGIRDKKLDKNINLPGWWNKILLFNKDLDIRGTVLFLDLDIVIHSSIDILFTYQAGKFAIIRDFTRYARKKTTKFNSSVFRLETAQMSYVYDRFISDQSRIGKMFKGDQEWINHCVDGDYCFWPDEWIQSYKWEFKKQFSCASGRYLIDCSNSSSDDIISRSSILVFHGDPKPHECGDHFIQQHWR